MAAFAAFAHAAIAVGPGLEQLVAAVRVGEAVRVAVAVPQAQPEVHLVARLVDEVGDAVAALADAGGVVARARRR